MLELSHPNKVSAAARLDILKATVADASAIYQLGNDVFGKLQFLYTIYQAPQAVRHVERLIAANEPRHQFAVIYEDERLLGYYESLLNKEQAFLSYIATRPDSRHQGIGSSLLEHLQESARRSGSSKLALDVFRSNVRAVGWYERLGFCQESEINIARLALAELSPPNAASLDYSVEQFQAAVRDEATWGFSRFDGTCGSGRLSVGIIGGHTCKLLACEDVSLSDAVLCVAAHFRRDRQFVIFSFPGDLPSFATLATCESILRLSKELK